MKLPPESDYGVIITRHGEMTPEEKKQSRSAGYRARASAKDRAARQVIATYRRIELDNNELGAPWGSETRLVLQANGRLSLNNLDAEIFCKLQKTDVSLEQADRIAARYHFTRIG